MAQNNWQRRQAPLPDLFYSRRSYPRLLWVLGGVLLLGLLFFAARTVKNRTSPEEGLAPAVKAVQISGPGIDAAEPATASAADGSFYVAWVNHDAKKADVMLARFNNDGAMQGSPVRVNRQESVATAETKMRELGNTGAALSVAAGAELPTGVFSNDKLFVAYIGKEKEKRSIWLIRAE